MPVTSATPERDGGAASGARDQQIAATGPSTSPRRARTTGDADRQGAAGQRQLMVVRRSWESRGWRTRNAADVGGDSVARAGETGSGRGRVAAGSEKDKPAA